MLLALLCWQHRSLTPPGPFQACLARGIGTHPLTYASPWSTPPSARTWMIPGAPSGFCFCPDPHLHAQPLSSQHRRRAHSPVRAPPCPEPRHLATVCGPLWAPGASDCTSHTPLPPSPSCFLFLEHGVFAQAVPSPWNTLPRTSGGKLPTPSSLCPHVSSVSSPLTSLLSRELH